MFKVAKRHNLEVLEEYGFRVTGNKKCYHSFDDEIEYSIDINSKRLHTRGYLNYKQETMELNTSLFLFYKLIKDGIIEC